MIDIESLKANYFYFDLPVEYKLKSSDKTILIYPIKLKDSEIFLSSMDILSYDKNSSNSVEVIQMSYLQFLFDYVLYYFDENGEVKTNAGAFLKLYNILTLCLGFEGISFSFDENNKIYLYDKKLDVKIKAKDFDEIKRIIMYQNLPKYDDEYISPEVKKAMQEVDSLKNAGYEDMNIERKIAIISAHSGILKKDQLDMTLRSHILLFDEVCGEVEFTTTRNAMLINDMLSDSKKKTERPHWLFRKKKSKFADYFISDKAMNKKMGGDGNITKVSSNTDFSEKYKEFLNK